MLIAAVIADAGNFQIAAIAKISAPALATGVVLPAMPTDADPLPLLPRGNIFTDFIDDARHFVSGNAGILNSGPQSLFREYVAVANATGLHLDAHMPCSWFGNCALDDLEVSSGAGNLRDFHLCHLHGYDSACCHNSSSETFPFLFAI